jgi:hypothetical protein
LDLLLLIVDIKGDNIAIQGTKLSLQFNIQGMRPIVVDNRGFRTNMQSMEERERKYDMSTQQPEEKCGITTGTKDEIGQPLVMQQNGKQ